MHRTVNASLATLFSMVAVATNAIADQKEAAPDTSGLFDDLWARDSLSGDWGGWRDRWADHGAILAADSIDEMLGNPSGGERGAIVYDGRFELVATVDLEKLLGWSGSAFHANAYWTHGQGLSASALGGNFMTVSNIEAVPSVRLFDLWVEQLLASGTLSIRVGQIAADDEFLSSDTASGFNNSTFGWPAIMGADLPSGGPVYDIATPGIRFKYAPSDKFTFSVALFNGDSADPGPGNPQERNNNGLTFRVNGGAFVMAEAAYRSSLDFGGSDLPSTYKIGGWFHSSNFIDMHFDITGLSLASPMSTGIAATHAHNYGAYFVIDQTVWQKSGTEDSGISVFVRGAWAPADRNMMSLYADGGIAFKGVFSQRPDDVFGIALAIARVSPAVQALDRDVEKFSGQVFPVHDREATLEFTYHIQLNQWWSLQPDVQYVIHPGGNMAKAGTNIVIPNATIIGLRSSVVI